VQQLSSEETRRWAVWQQGYAVSARRSDGLCRIYLAAMFSVTATALGVALWLR
jgi:hypothetical protein